MVQLQVTGEQAGQSGQACPVRLGGTSDVDLRAKHRDFVAGDQAQMTSFGTV